MQKQTQRHRKRTDGCQSGAGLEHWVKRGERTKTHELIVTE